MISFALYSLGITIFELACFVDLPRGGDLWQNLRDGRLPTEFTRGIDALFYAMENVDSLSDSFIKSHVGFAYFPFILRNISRSLGAYQKDDV